MIAWTLTAVTTSRATPWPIEISQNAGVFSACRACGLCDRGAHAPTALFRARTFPHTWRFVAGGCVIEDNAPDRELVRYCPECRRAEEAWLREKETSDKALAALEERIRSLSEAEDYRSAIPIARWKLTIMEKNRGPDDLDVAECWRILGTLLVLNGDVAEAERALTRSMLTMEKVLGPDDPSFAWYQTELACFYLRIDKWTEAAWLYARSLPVLENDGGPEDRKVIDTVMGLARARLGQGEYAEAEALYTRALEATEKKIGPNDRRVAECLAFMAQLYEMTGRAEKAEHLKKRVAAIKAGQ